MHARVYTFFRDKFKQVRIHYVTGTGGLVHMRQAHSPGGSTFLHEMTSWPPSWIYNFISKSRTLSIDARVSEQLNKKFPIGTRFYNFDSYTDSIPSNSSPLKCRNFTYLLHLSSASSYRLYLGLFQADAVTQRDRPIALDPDHS